MAEQSTIKDNDLEDIIVRNRICLYFEPTRQEWRAYKDNWSCAEFAGSPYSAVTAFLQRRARESFRAQEGSKSGGFSLSAGTET